MHARSLTPMALALLAIAPVVGAAGVTLEAPAAALVGVLAGGLAAGAAVRGIRRDPVLLLFGALLGWAALLMFLRPVDLAPATWTLAGGVVVLAAAAAAQRPRAQAGARWGVAVAGGAAAAYLVIERLAKGVRPGGPLEHPGLSATLAVLGLALLPTLGAPLAARVVAGTVLLAGVVASGSRAAMLGATAVALAWGWSRAGRLTRIAAVVLAGVALAGLAGRLLSDTDPLRWERIRIWRVAIRTVLAETPWGAGPAGFADAALPHNFPREGELARFYREPSLAESDLLQLAASLGLPGVVLAGALAALLLRRTTRAGLGVLAALAATSAVSTQLPVPAVSMAASLAVAGTLRRPRAVTLWRCSPGQALAGGVSLAVVAGLALSWPRPGITADAETLAAEARRLAATDLARATVLAGEAIVRRPRWGEGHRLLGSLYLMRGLERREVALVERAAEAFATARKLNPQDAFAAYGEAECATVLGRRGQARQLAQLALRQERNLARAWLLLAALELGEGRLQSACDALRQAEASRQAALGVVMISAYERELARWDGARATLVADACGAGR